MSKYNFSLAATSDYEVILKSFYEAFSFEKNNKEHDSILKYVNDYLAKQTRAKT